jgi:hypothetical protein
MSMLYPVLSLASCTAWAIKVEAILNVQGFLDVVSPLSDGKEDERKNKTTRT